MHEQKILRSKDNKIFIQLPIDSRLIFLLLYFFLYRKKSLFYIFLMIKINDL